MHLSIFKKPAMIIISLLIILLTIATPICARADLTDTAISMAEVVYGTSSDVFSRIQSIVSINIGVDDSGETPYSTYNGSDESNKQISEAQVAIWAYAAKIYNAIKSVAFLIITVYFLTDLMDRTTKDQLTPEHFLRQFIKFFIGIMFVNNGMRFFGWIMQLSNAFLDSVNNGVFAATQDNEALNLIKDDLNSGNFITRWFKALSYLFTLIIPWLGMQLASVIIYFFAWARFIELGVRIAFAPIGMADVFTDGFNGSGFRYFKKVVAVMMQGMFILAIVALCNAASAGIAGSALSNNDLQGFGQLILPLTEIGLIKRSQTFANELLGVG